MRPGLRILVFLVVGLAACSAQHTLTFVEGQPSADIVCGLSVSQEGQRVGQPVQVLVSLANRGARAVKIPLGDTHVRLYLHHIEKGKLEEGELRLISYNANTPGPESVSDFSSYFRPLESQERVVVSLSENDAFSESGTWFVRAVFQVDAEFKKHRADVWTGQALSGFVKLTVLPRESSPVEVELRTPATTFSANDSILLQVRIRNTSVSAVRVPVGSSNLKVEVRLAGRPDEIPLIQEAKISSPFEESGEERLLEPGREMWVPIKITRPPEGSYEVKVTYSETQTLTCSTTSKPVLIQVTR